MGPLLHWLCVRLACGPRRVGIATTTGRGRPAEPKVCKPRRDLCEPQREVTRLVMLEEGSVHICHTDYERPLPRGDQGHHA